MKKKSYLILTVVVLMVITIIGSLTYLAKIGTQNCKVAKVKENPKLNDFILSPGYKNTSISNLPSDWIIKTKYYDKDTETTLWTYHYTEKYDKKKKAWDFKNTDVYVLKDCKWINANLNKVQPSGNVSSVKLEKRSKGAYLVQVVGQEKKKSNGILGSFFDKFLIDCAKSQVTEGDF